MPLRPRPEVEKLESCPHGGPNRAELESAGLNPDDVLDFSVSSNPFPPPSGVKEAVGKAVIDRYPDSESTELRQALAGKMDIDMSNILVGSGSMELIRLISLAYFRPGDRVLILTPTFGEYEVACKIMGAEVVRQRGRAEDNFIWRMDETADFIRQHRPGAIFICNPNSPTGSYLPRQEIETLLGNSRDSLVVIDETFIAFVDEGWSSLDLAVRDNVVILRSMTKDYGLAGLRLGYVIAHAEIIDLLRRVCPPWNVNAAAQQAGLAALEDTDYVERCKREIRQSKRFLTGEFRRLGFDVVPSEVNFFLVKVSDAGAFRIALLKRGIQVRDCSSFGLPGYVRIAARTIAECRRLIAAVEDSKYKNGRGV